MPSRTKSLGMHYEWEFKKLVEEYTSQYYVWHIGGSTPGWDNLMFKVNSNRVRWNSMIPFENKSFVSDSKVYKKQSIMQFETYMRIYTERGIVTYYALRHKNLGQGVATIERWRVLPVMEIKVSEGPNGGFSISYSWDNAMPLDKFLDILLGKEPTKSMRNKWKWIDKMGGP